MGLKMSGRNAGKLGSKLVRMNPTRLKRRYPKQVETLSQPNPLAPDYVGTFSPPTHYKSHQ
jgi:hypothetical protein